jgi:formylglycine-generating enzyme required for sulfatase activity
VADKNGTRLEGAPTEIVVDPLRFQTDGVVTPGVSCMSCHTKGIKKHDDETLAQFESLEALFKNNGSNPRLEKLVSDVKRIYKGNTILNQKYEQDEAAYTDAIQKTGNSTDNPDPVHATAAQFEAPLDMRAMAAELGHTPEEVEGAINNNFELKQKLALGSQHTVDRTTFNANFKLMKRVLEKAKEPAGGTVPVSRDPSVDEYFEFVSVTPGTYQTRRGGRDYRGSWEEQSVTVTISKPFDIQTTEVTQSLWKKVMGNNPSQFVGDNRPVENVFKSEVQEFIRRLNETPEVKKSSFKYRLPTSDEWEYAARGANSPAANMESVFSFGNDRSEANDFGWFVDNSGGQTHDVGDSSKQPNAMNLHDIHGNVKELVEDVLVDRLVMNIAKGGAFHSDPQRLDQRELILASENSKYDKSGVGFRLVRVSK